LLLLESREATPVSFGRPPMPMLMLLLQVKRRQARVLPRLPPPRFRSRCRWIHRH
jgi:hypothetical protein